MLGAPKDNTYLIFKDSYSLSMTRSKYALRMGILNSQVDWFRIVLAF